jgi:hypothetical protein
MSKVMSTLQQNFLFRIYKYYIIDSVFIVKNKGFKELLRARGFKFILVILAYYIVRDSIAYIVVPVLVAKGLF